MNFRVGDAETASVWTVGLQTLLARDAESVEATFLRARVQRRLRALAEAKGLAPAQYLTKAMNWMGTAQEALSPVPLSAKAEQARLTPEEGTICV